MIKVLPPEITPSDVMSMLALLDVTTPYLNTERGWVYFELGDPKTSPFPPIYVALKDDKSELSASLAAAEAITLLPHLHAWVVNYEDDPDTISDECVLSHLEVDDGEIDVCYTPSVNATWRNSFCQDEAGLWRPWGFNSSIVEVPKLLCPATFSPSWRTDTALAVARQMYESRDFCALPILADALQDAGCDNANILDHCRGSGAHVRGCWVVDLVIGKEYLRSRTRRCTGPAGGIGFSQA